MAKIIIQVGEFSLDSIDDIEPSEILDAGDEALEQLASKMGHELVIDRIPFSSSPFRVCDVETRSFDRANVERRLSRLFEAEWDRATDRAIENA